MDPEILFLQNFQVSQNIIFFEFPPNHACKTVKKKKSFLAHRPYKNRLQPKTIKVKKTKEKHDFGLAVIS